MQWNGSIVLFDYRNKTPFPLSVVHRKSFQIAICVVKRISISRAHSDIRMNSIANQRHEFVCVIVYVNEYVKWIYGD